MTSGLPQGLQHMVIFRPTYAQLHAAGYEAPPVVQDLVHTVMKACCANPSPQLMWDSHAGKMVLQCMNCGAFC